MKICTLNKFTISWHIEAIYDIYILQDNQTSTDSDVGRRLKGGVREGTRVGILLTRDGQLYLYVDGQCIQ